MKLDLNDREWRKFLISELFVIGTGANIPKTKLLEGDIARVTATDLNNGVFGYYKRLKVKNYREIENFISISFLGSVFYHPYKASLDMKIHSLKLKQIELNNHIANFIVFSLKRSTSKYSYGYQLSSSILPDLEILLPVNKSGEPDYKFMEAYMKQQEKEKLQKYSSYIKNRVNELKNYKEVEPLEVKEWVVFSLIDIFPEIKRGKRLKKADHISGKVPYISSTALNNGIDAFLGNYKNVRIYENCLTIANSGSVGACFYHPYNFVASDHVTHLQNEKFNEYVYKFISSIIKRLGVKYSFNREMNDTRIKKERILLPINDQKEPDYEYMENYMKKLEYIKLKQYLEYKGL